MIKLLKHLTLLIVMASPTVVSASQTPEPYSLMASEIHEFQSELLGANITITVGLPFNYQPDTTNYPMVFHTDGDVMFAMGTEILRLMSFEGNVPPVITVSVSYGDFGSWINARQRDYHPPSTAAESAGAARFLNVLKNEVTPFLRDRYALSESGHVLYGHSSGGLFAMFTAFQEPALFDHVLISSPSVEEEQNWAEDLVERYDGETLPKLFFSIGGEEKETRPLLDKVIAMLRSKSPNQAIAYEAFPGASHMAVISPAYTAGMRYLFATDEKPIP
ncbi:MAG: alpha/beta hydrolase-fold protein [Pseudomonadota bacterium]